MQFKKRWSTDFEVLQFTNIPSGHTPKIPGVLVSGRAVDLRDLDAVDVVAGGVGGVAPVVRDDPQHGLGLFALDREVDVLSAVEAAQPADPHVAQPRVHDLEAVPVAGTGQARAGIQGEVRKVQPGEEDTEFMSKIFIPFFFLHTFFFRETSLRPCGFLFSNR